MVNGENRDDKTRIFAYCPFTIDYSPLTFHK
jgi:hypothetical protein